MELHELVDMANEDEEYVLAVIESREPNDYSLMCTVETYERAKEYEKQLHADGVMDTIIIPPFTSDKVNLTRLQTILGVTIINRYMSQRLSIVGL